MSRYSSAEVLERVLQAPLVPVFFHADAAYAQRVVQACYEGGVRVFEFTNRGTNALEVFTELQRYVQEHLPEMVLGIGTIYTAAQAEEFISAGAAFVVQPIMTAEVGEACRLQDVAWVPGAMTLTEVYNAQRLGAGLVKIFPGNVLGPDFIKSLRGPMPTVKLMVTGGVEPTEASLTEWFGAGVNVVGIGSQLFKGADDVAVIAPRIAPLMQFLTSRAS
ncbi:bifunctional 4-hydroxy-2-oxoglutarate aldolase/2-dehydro-3-deoxy-phosphogluconate aldolase [Hymenobacter cellulosilyticus]|uniref:Bifunctional 4-hydroxy-2-oxoglutarate aldolase/2-dehydro-3-deoxy-phosphogluconate aldolase n=1 Tax=Hymenobacter cellulosilyticus TaxID=2932248 RepID=A0A8T9Q2M6_9BACT|nr:bifunctional 4-hydroxy-2-oxoglutarate aldolase/2-dehydro-3-deoxy-phosphogluconate aldolase [Hymenobacter cellulosilyticus]UOQ71275.1 bifunctional 4-hydroxy-2-oxoglutarate aldolase/2-dehydro-3-deoxy-phosphogluconate aldolase [Hymenobacter cellulosilyticus]